MGWLSLTAHATPGFLQNSTKGGFVVMPGTPPTYTVGNITNTPPTGTWQAPPGSGTVTYGNGAASGGAGGPAWTSRGKMPVNTPTGKATVPVDVKQPIPKPSAAKAIGKFLGKIAGPVGWGLAAYELAEDLGFTLTNNDGQAGAEVWKKRPGSCTVAPCWEYYAGGGTGWQTTPQAACQARASTDGGTLTGVDLLPTYSGEPLRAGICLINTGNSQLLVQPRTPDTQAQVDPAAMQELEDAIASQSGWPSSATRAMVDALNSGEQVEYDSEDAETSGPASTPGPTETKQEPTSKPGANPGDPDVPGTKTTTTQSTVNNTYNGNTYNTTVTTTTTTTYNYADGTGKTETSTEEKKPEDKDPCEGAQDTLGCQKLEEPEKGQIPRADVNLTYHAESPFGGGSCPANKTMNLRGQTLVVVDWVKWCDLTATYVRPLIILLATISAFFIVAVGKDQS